MTETYPFFVIQDSGKKVPIVQAYAYTKYLGKLMVTFDDNGDVKSAQGNPQLLDHSIPKGESMNRRTNIYAGVYVSRYLYIFTVD